MNGDLDMSTLISGMLSDPEMLSRAMNIAKGLASSGVLSSLLSQGDKGSGKGECHDNPSESASCSDEKGALLRSGCGGSAGDGLDKGERRKPGNAERTALLHALKPYVSEDKREKIELIIKLMSVLDAAHGIGIK